MADQRLPNVEAAVVEEETEAEDLIASVVVVGKFSSNTNRPGARS